MIQHKFTHLSIPWRNVVLLSFGSQRKCCSLLNPWEKIWITHHHRHRSRKEREMVVINIKIIVCPTRASSRVCMPRPAQPSPARRLMMCGGFGHKNKTVTTNDMTGFLHANVRARGHKHKIPSSCRHHCLRRSSTWSSSFPCLSHIYVFVDAAALDKKQSDTSCPDAHPFVHRRRRKWVDAEGQKSVLSFIHLISICHERYGLRL